MTTLKRLTVAVAGLLVWASPALHAEMLSGDYTNAFDGLINLWDLSGTYSEDLEGISLNYTINTEPNGKLTGNGSASVQDLLGYNGDLNIGLNFNGTVSSAGSVVRTTMTMKMTGEGYIEGYYCTFRGTATERVEIDQTNRQMVGWASGRVSVSIPSMHRSASAPIPRTEVQVALPEGATGLWNVAYNVSTNKTKYLGAGTLSLDNGRSFPLRATGSYVRRSNVSTITLKGQDLNRAINLKLTACCTNAQLLVKNLTGKALGQTLRMPKP